VLFDQILDAAVAGATIAACAAGTGDFLTGVGPIGNGGANPVVGDGEAAADVHRDEHLSENGYRYKRKSITVFNKRKKREAPADRGLSKYWILPKNQP
jgi:hypothetical protein